MKGKPGRPKQEKTVNNVNQLSASKGNSKAYTLSRLKRESPELFAAVCDGELSANAAAIKAGFRAERKLGAALAAMDKAQGKRTDLVSSCNQVKAPTLDDLGITKTQSHRWQKIASTFRRTMRSVQCRALSLCTKRRVSLTPAGVIFGHKWLFLAECRKSVLA
jgi:hypothetical protein